MGLFSGLASFCTNAVSKLTSFFTGNSGKAVANAVSSYAGKSYSGGSSTTHTITTTNHNTTTTTYDPDRVKAAQLDKERAEIESSSQIRLAGMEKERLEFMRRAQLDIIEAQTQSRIAQERARAEGFVIIADAISAMQEKLNELAAQRLAIIERGNLQAVREAENFYDELTRAINEDHEEYMSQKLPALFEILSHYEAGTSVHSLYFETIQRDIALQMTHTAQQLESARLRREKMIESIHETKREITAHSGQTEKITAGILETLREKIAEIDTRNVQLPGVKEIPALPA